MKTKLKLLIPVLALTLAAFYTAPKKALACSGDDCGCGLTMQACFAACPVPDLNHCKADCRHEDVQCALACCGGV